MGSLTSSAFYEYNDLSHPTFDQHFADFSKIINDLREDDTLKSMSTLYGGGIDNQHNQVRDMAEQMQICKNEEKNSRNTLREKNIDDAFRNSMSAFKTQEEEDCCLFSNSKLETEQPFNIKSIDPNYHDPNKNNFNFEKLNEAKIEDIKLVDVLRYSKQRMHGSKLIMEDDVSTIIKAFNNELSEKLNRSKDSRDDVTNITIIRSLKKIPSLILKRMYTPTQLKTYKIEEIYDSYWKCFNNVFIVLFKPLEKLEDSQKYELFK